MGWTFISKPDNIKQFFTEMFEDDGDKIKYKVLDAKIVSLRTLYMAIEKTYPESKDRDVFGLVVLLDMTSARKEYHNFGYKIIDENACPYYFKCPKSILDLLTETQNENALKWRERCREYAMMTKPKPGQFVLLNHAVGLTEDKKDSLFRVCKDNCNKTTYYAMEQKFLCRITAIKDIGYRVFDTIEEAKCEQNKQLMEAEKVRMSKEIMDNARADKDAIMA